MKNEVTKFYRISQLVDMLNVSKSSIYLWMQQGHFPHSKKIGNNTSVWSDADIQNWLDQNSLNG